MRKLLYAIMLTAIAIPAMPVAAQRQDHGQSSAPRTPERGHRDQRRQPSENHQNADRQYRNDPSDHRRQARRAPSRPAWHSYRRYDYNHADPRHGAYQADRYYRSGQ